MSINYVIPFVAVLLIANAAGAPDWVVLALSLAIIAVALLSMTKINLRKL